MLYQLSHRGSSAGQAKSLNVMHRQRCFFPDKQGNSFSALYVSDNPCTCTLYMVFLPPALPATGPCSTDGGPCVGAAVGDGQAGDLGGGRTSAGKDAELLCHVRHAGLQGEGNSRGRGYVQSCHCEPLIGSGWSVVVVYRVLRVLYSLPVLPLVFLPSTLPLLTSVEQEMLQWANLCNTLPSLYNQEHALTTYIICFASHYYMYIKVMG